MRTSKLHTTWNSHFTNTYQHLHNSTKIGNNLLRSLDPPKDTYFIGNSVTAKLELLSCSYLQHHKLKHCEIFGINSSNIQENYMKTEE